MDATHLTPEQRKALILYLNKRAEEVLKVQKRMEEKCWYTEDPAYMGIQASYQALRATIRMIAIASKLPPPPPAFDPNDPMCPAHAKGPAGGVNGRVRRVR